MNPQVAELLADIADNTLAEALARRGWHCVRVSAFEWETPKQFDERHHKSRNWLARQLYHERNLPEFEKHCGKSGRIVRLRSNPELEEYTSKTRL